MRSTRRANTNRTGRKLDYALARPSLGLKTLEALRLGTLSRRLRGHAQPAPAGSTQHPAEAVNNQNCQRPRWRANRYSGLLNN
jgi:hypothetical protein